MKAIFAGSFDPFTMGHAEIVTKALGVFSEIVIAIADNGGKVVADVKKRCEIAKVSLSNSKNVVIKPFSGLLTDFMTSENCTFMIRGLRDSADFLYEQNLAAVYKSQNTEIEQVYFITTHKYKHISGTIVRELARLGGNLDGYVAKPAQELVKAVYRESEK